ncbi:phosphate-binding protein [Salinadaptatus halalkaliphilus]|uniref:Phosphate-binding protein n=1 Tax=Salinadaptatus halalkaliphilus TaxID=2419781 RepID=A0A4S3TQH7_9EURY|nr:substrate-binding domain-containing protein [Salinadaptatus halalkaliphilus]THE66632.1 phosphate-binding protein [Salinadaptatus halalkaliphilus]
MVRQSDCGDSSRRTFLKASGGVAVTTAIAGCLGGTGNGNGNGNGTSSDDGNGGNGDGDQTVEFILNPAEADVAIEEQYSPIFDYLEEETGATIESTRTESYTETLTAMRDGHGEIADISPSAVLAGTDIVDIIGMRLAFGAAQYFTTVVTTPDSGIEELSDLGGETVAFSDILSVSGSLVPLTMLAEAGLDTGTAPDGDPVDFEAEWSDHTTAVNQMYNRDDVAAAGVGAFAGAPHLPESAFDDYEEFRDISAEYPDNVGADLDEMEFELVDVSNPLPRAPLVSRSDWNDPIREDIEEALLDAPEDVFQAPDGVEELWFSGVEPATVDDYDPIQDVMDELGLEFEDLE